MPVACWLADAAICAAVERGLRQQLSQPLDGGARLGHHARRRRPRSWCPPRSSSPPTWVAFWMWPRICRTWAVAFLDWSASAFTSAATTAKPRPCSPARLASMEALSASMCVCSEMSLTVLMMSPMACACSARARMREAMDSTCSRTVAMEVTASSTAGARCGPAPRTGGRTRSPRARARRPPRTSGRSPPPCSPSPRRRCPAPGRWPPARWCWRGSARWRRPAG